MRSSTLWRTNSSGKRRRPFCTPLRVEDDGVRLRGAADQPHVAQHALVFAEAEGAGRGDLCAVRAGCQIDRELLAADGRGEVDRVVDAVAVAGIDADELVVLAHFDLEDADVFAAAALDLDADVVEGFDIGKRAAVEDGEFEVVDLDDDVVDAGADAGGEKVLGGGDEDALAHEAGGVGDLGDVAAGGGDFEVVEVGAAEDDAGAGGGGKKPQTGRGRRCEDRFRKMRCCRRLSVRVEPALRRGHPCRMLASPIAEATDFDF